MNQWLPKQRKTDEQDAKQVLLRRYLSADGPATIHDFSKWAGVPMQETKAIWDSLGDELVEVSVEGKKASLLRENQKALANSAPGEPMLRLLPPFDPFLLAHTDKGHLVDDRHYKRVYRNAGWISAVVLLNGGVIGTWSYARGGKGVTLQIVLFEKPSKALRAAIEREAASLAALMEAPCQVTYSR